MHPDGWESLQMALPFFMPNSGSQEKLWELGDRRQKLELRRGVQEKCWLLIYVSIVRNVGQAHLT
jgi:hypothetical protein